MLNEDIRLIIVPHVLFVGEVGKGEKDEENINEDLENTKEIENVKMMSILWIDTSMQLNNI